MTDEQRNHMEEGFRKHFGFNVDTAAMANFEDGYIYALTLQPNHSKPKPNVDAVINLIKSAPDEAFDSAWNGELDESPKVDHSDLISELKRVKALTARHRDLGNTALIGYVRANLKVGKFTYSKGRPCLTCIAKRSVAKSNAMQTERR